ncbi:hypothetical protein PHYBOEH_010441 [Phytophthora boehmeriae]|uniref:Uncharacterized protein n=1 Tax=Phytophthora boehmeriae TaxID=109152 RepID=A0A8T1X4H4_9STRA|nr:hypothetical protein PHYBOEH_010441 [Phytophthora boehmeriae]
MMPLFLLIVATVIAAASASHDPQDAPPVLDLYPDQPLQSQHLPYGTTQVYRVSDLQPAKVYDIKVSYPASVPSLFSLQVERVLLPLPVATDNNENDGRSTIKIPPRRRVLNTAKLRLHPQDLETHESVRYRLEPAGDAIQVEFSLTAQTEGVARSGRQQRQECVFDIVVEEVLLQAFPKSTLVLIGWLLAILAGGARWVLPYVERKIALGCVEDRASAAEAKQS